MKVMRFYGRLIKLDVRKKIEKWCENIFNVRCTKKSAFCNVANGRENTFDS